MISLEITERNIMEATPYRASLPCIQKPGMRGTFDPVENQPYFLIPPISTGSIRVLQATAKIPVEGVRTPFVGHMDVYDELLPPFTAREIPAIRAWRRLLHLLPVVVSNHDVVMLRGGKHIGKEVHHDIVENSPTAIQFGGYDQDADAIDMGLASAALNNEQVFLDATCRGMHVALAVATDVPPEEIEGHCPPEGSSEMVMHDVQNVFYDLYGFECPVELPEISVVNSFHRQGYRLDTLAPYLSGMARKGLFVTHVGPGNVVEMVVGISGGRTTAAVRQFHGERQPDQNGETLRNWNRRAISRFVE